MKRTPLKKLGTIGKANREARKRIAEIAEEKGLNYCEVQLEGCLGGMYLAPAHLHKRAWYKGDVDLLSDYCQWVAACQNCHARMEFDEKLTNIVFEELRP